MMTDLPQVFRLLRRLAYGFGSGPRSPTSHLVTGYVIFLPKTRTWSEAGCAAVLDCKGSKVSDRPPGLPHRPSKSVLVCLRFGHEKADSRDLGRPFTPPPKRT